MITTSLLLNKLFCYFLQGNHTPCSYLKVNGLLYSVEIFHRYGGNHGKIKGYGYTISKKEVHFIKMYFFF